MSEKFTQLFENDVVWDLLDPNAIVYLCVSLIIFYIGKKFYDLVIPYDLDHELVKIDNKAVAVSLCGFLIGLGIILWGILGDSPDKVILSKSDLQLDLVSVFVWGAIGIMLLQLARIINDKLVLHRFDNIKEIITDKNVGTGAVQCGAFIASGLMIRGSLIGDEGSFLENLGLVLIFFFVGQLGLLLYSKLYQFMAKYDIHDEIEKDNAAAGVAFGMSLVAEGILLAGYMKKYDSLLGLAIWFIIGTVLLLVAKALVDKFILPGEKLNEEIQKDQNWGAAMVEGSTAIIFAFILNAAF